MEQIKERLNAWNQCLEKTSEMLEIVKKRNVLLKSSSEVEKAFRKDEAAFEKFLLNLKKFDKEYADEKTSDLIKTLETAVENLLKERKNAVATHLVEYHEAVDLTNEIERHKSWINFLLTVYLNNYLRFDLTEKEMPEDKMYEVIALILLANENNGKITEINFFENSELLIKRIKESNDPVLSQLILDDKQAITYRNTLEGFFELL